MADGGPIWQLTFFKLFHQWNRWLCLEQCHGHCVRYGSFLGGYLHQFPVDILKIDRSFVSRMSGAEEKREIVKIIIALANSLGMDAIAEGIETLDQLSQLQQLQCKYGQGYFFAKPLSRTEAEELLTQSHLEVS